MGLHQPTLAQRYADPILGLRNGHTVFLERADAVGTRPYRGPLRSCGMN